MNWQQAAHQRADGRAGNTYTQWQFPGPFRGHSKEGCLEMKGVTK